MGTGSMEMKEHAEINATGGLTITAAEGSSRQEALDLKWSDITLDFGDSGLIRFYRTKKKQERLQQGLETHPRRMQFQNED